MLSRTSWTATGLAGHTAIMTTYPPAAVREILGEILAWSAHAQWWITPIPELGGETPQACWRRGECLRVFDLVEAYGKDCAFT